MTGFGEARQAAAIVPQGAGASDQDIFADDIKGKQAVHGIAQRIEDRADFKRERVRQRMRVEGGMTRYSAKAPGRFTPTLCVSGSR